MAELYYGVPDQIPNYQTQIDQGMADSKEALDAARTVVINRREKDREFKTNLYKNDLGEMYDGDRESAEKMRQYIEYQYEQGLYNDDPSKFARIVADYNAQIDMFTGHYKNTHGIAGTADGTGNTYLDVQLRQQQNNSDKFWGETGNRVVGNEFDQAQETYNQLNAGLQGMNVDEAGNFVATDPLTGDTVRISDLAQYQLGNSAFMPDLEKVAPPTLYDVASAAETATAVKLRMQTVKEDGSAVTADEAAGAEFDNLMGTRNAPGSVITERQRKFRELTIRDLADQAGLGLSDEEIEAFITGDLSNHPDRMDEFAFMIKKARETFIDVNRFGGDDSGSRSSSGDSSIPGLSGQSRNIPLNAGGLQITEDSDASGDPDARSTRPEGDTLDVAAYQLDEPIEESETNPNGAYSVTHISTGPRGEHMVEVNTIVPMVRDIETGNLRPANADDPSSSIIDVPIPEYIDIDGDDPRAEEIRRNLAARGITDETWVSMGQDTNRRLQEDNERRRGEIERQNQRAEATDVQPDNRIPPESLPPDQPTDQQPRPQPGSDDQTAPATQAPSTPPEGSSGNAFRDFLNDPFGFLFPGSGSTEVPSEERSGGSPLPETSPERQERTQSRDELVDRSAEDLASLPLDTRAEVQRIQDEYRNRTGVLPYPVINTDENGRQSVGFVDDRGNPLDDITLENQINSQTAIPTTEEEVEQRQAEGVVRDPSERQRDVAVANAPAAEAIINSEATTPTPESEELVVQELQNAPEEITVDDVQDMTPVGLALSLLGTNEDENAEVIQAMMDRWLGPDVLNVTTDSGAWCAAFVSSVLADSGYVETLGPVRAGEAYGETDNRRGSRYNPTRAKAFEAIGTAVEFDQARIGDIVVVQGSGGGGSRHVGFFAGYDSDGSIKILGGNQGDEVNVTRFSSRTIIAVRRPFEERPTQGEIDQLSQVAVKDSSSTS